MDKVIISIKNYCDKEKIKTFLITLIAVMICHFQLYSLIITGPDTLFGSLSYNSRAYDAGLGRFSLYYTQIAKGNVVSPFLATLLSAIFIAISVVLIIDIFKIKNKYFKIFTALIIAVSPNISATLTFFFCSDGYTLGMLLAVLAVFIVTKFENNRFIPILGGLFIAFSIGMYQTYLAISMVLFAGLILIDLLNNEKGKIILKRCFKYLITCFIGLVLYYLFMKLALITRNVEMSSYSGANQIGLSTLLLLPKLLPETYERFFDYYFGNYVVPNVIWHTNIVYVFLFGTLITSLITLVIENKLYKRLVFIFGILLILPICFGIIEIIVPNVDIHVLMGCAYIFIFPIIFKIVELINKNDISRIIKIGVVLCTILIIWIYTWQDNASYINMNKNNIQIKAIMNRIVTRVEELDDYNPKMPILIIGQIEYNDYLKTDNYVSKRTWGFISNAPLIWKNNENSWKKFFYEYMGVNANFVNIYDSKDILNTDEYKQMEVYPSNSSIKIINDTVVIKLQQI